MLQFDGSRYVDAKQYHLASLSTRNSTLNSSLRKPIRVQDFIQLCDSTLNTSLSKPIRMQDFIQLCDSVLNCARKPISHESRSDECDIGFQVQFNAEFSSQVMNFP